MKTSSKRRKSISASRKAPASPSEATSRKALGEVQAARVLAQTLRQRKALPQALEAWQKVAELAPDDSEAWLQSARIAWTLKDAETTQRCAEAVLRLEPDNVEALRWLARAHRQLEALPQALETWRRVAELAPGDSGAWLQSARIAWTLKDAETTQRCAEAVLCLEPDNVEALRWLARAHRRREALPQALETWRRVAELLPGDSGAWLQSARIAWALKDAETTQRCAEAALGLEPDNSDALRLLAHAYQHHDKAQEALGIWQRIGEQAPGDAEALLKIARLAWSTGDADKAESQAKALLSVAPNGRDALALLATIFYRQRRFDDLAEILTTYAGENWTDAVKYLYVLESAERHQLLADTVSQILKSAPPDHEIVAWAGKINFRWLADAATFLKSGDKCDAIALYKAVLTVHPDNGEAKELLNRPSPGAATPAGNPAKES